MSEGIRKLVENINLSDNGIIAILSGNNEAFKIGDKVKTRGDMGSFKMIIKHIYNKHYCICIDDKFFNKKIRHFNMGFLERVITR